MKIVENLVQRTPEWHDFRLGGIGGSEIGAVMGISPYQTPLQLFLEKTGAIKRKDISKNPNVRRGVKYEDHIAGIVNDHFGDHGSSLCGIHEEFDFIRVSFDLVSATRYYEIKAIGDTQWEWVKQHGAHPWYMAQAQYQGIVAEKLGLEGKLVYWRQVETAEGTKEEVMIFDVVISEETRSNIIEAAKHFWDLIERGVPPEADPKRDVLSEVEMTDEQLELWTAISERVILRAIATKKCKDEIAKLEKGDEVDEAALLDLIGDRFSGAAKGVRFTRFWKGGSVDYATAIHKLAPEVKTEEWEEYRKKGSWQQKVTIEKAALKETQKALAEGGEDLSEQLLKKEELMLEQQAAAKLLKHQETELVLQQAA